MSKSREEDIDAQDMLDEMADLADAAIGLAQPITNATPCTRNGCGHPFEWHDAAGCNTIVRDGRTMMDDPDYCECKGFVA